MLTTIIGLSIIIWYIIDRGKTLWSCLEHGKWITIGVSAALGAAVTFTYGLDIVNGLGVSDQTTIVGQVLTVLSFMGGSSFIAELVDKFQAPVIVEYENYEEEE